MPPSEFSTRAAREQALGGTAEIFTHAAVRLVKQQLVPCSGRSSVGGRSFTRRLVAGDYSSAGDLTDIEASLAQATVVAS
jgi:hypothetical protein